MKTASLRYNFDTESWEAIADWNGDLVFSGDTPEEAMNNLRHQCNKHELWSR